MVTYWIVLPIIVLGITRSLSFFFFIYLQPFICMSYFLGFINFGFHGFIEFDEDGKNIWCVNSSTIIEGDDDYFGEDDHMLHHYATQVYYKNVNDYRQTKIEDLKKYNASVFRKLSIVELSAFLLFNDWNRLAKHYVDLTGKLTKEQIIKMLQERAKRKEISFEDYQKWRMINLQVL